MQENARKRILVFATAYLPYVGGAEVALKEITDRLAGSGDFEFDLITPAYSLNDKSFEKIGGVNIYRVGRWLAFLPRIFGQGYFALLAGPLKAFSLNAKNKYAMIFALQASFGGIAGALSKYILRLPMLLNFQEGKELHKQWFFMRWSRSFALKSADWVTAISIHLMLTARRSGVDARHISIIPNGVDTNIFKPMTLEEGNETRLRLGLPIDKRIIITASRLVYKNGVDVLIKAMSLTKDTSAILLIAGDGALRKEYENLVDNLKLKDRVRFLGSLNHKELANYIECSDIFARPSRSEGLGNAFLEAMSAGTPIIATSVGGIKDFLTNEITGLEVKIDDPASIASAIDRYNEDEKLYSDIRKFGMQHVNDFYTWDLTAEQYRKDFNTLINNGKIEYSTNPYPKKGKRVLVITQKIDTVDDLLGFFPVWIEELAKRSAQVDVLTLYWGAYVPPENVKIISLGKDVGIGRYLRWILFFWHMIFLSRRKDIIFAHMSPIFAIASWPFARLYGAQLVLWYVHRSITRRLELAERLVDRILTTTKESFRISSKKVSYVGHGIHAQHFSMKEKWHEVGDIWNFIAVGRLSKIKNYETLLGALQLLKEAGFKFHLKIIGQPIMNADKEYAQGLYNFIKNNNMSNEVEFVGFVPYPKVARYYKEADIAFNMTPTGGLDKAVLEPMSCGVATIISNTAFKSILGEFAEDFIFCYNNPASLKDAIIKVSKMDLKYIGKILRARVIKDHSISGVVSHILDD